MYLDLEPEYPAEFMLAFLAKLKNLDGWMKSR